ncbi:MAG TPA: WYL domain-containing protein [Actinomycetota bacterium]|nr:WYL domain-containing protein [Actinomycetota bacterium]
MAEAQGRKGDRTKRPSARARSTPKSSVRLRRLLAAVPYIVRHPGVRVAEVAALFGMQERDLVQDLNLLFMAGLPPYGPGDLVDVEIDEGGRVWIRMADYFSRPVRLTSSEAFSLYLRGKALLGTPGLEEAGPLASALDKIEASLGPDALSRLVERVRAQSGAGFERILTVLRRAADDHRRVRMEYFSASRDELTTREVEPEHVFAAMGHWYVVGWDPAVEDERMFRADRVRSAEDTGERFEPRGLAGPERPLYSRSEEDRPVRLRLGPAARWVAEYYVVEDVRETPDGALEVTLPTKDLPWVAKLVLRLGGEVVALEPPELSPMVRAAAARALAPYRRSRSGDD